MGHVIRNLAAAVLFLCSAGWTSAQVAGLAILVPDTVDPGARVTVSVTRSDAGTLVIDGPLDQTSEGAELGRVPVAGGQAILMAPSRPGTYRLRHLGPTGRDLAAAMIDVSALPVTLSAETNMGYNVEIPVRWRGPAAPGDRLIIVAPATGGELSAVPALGIPGDLTRTLMPGVRQQGEVELRYVTVDGIILQRVRLMINPPIR